MIGGANVHAGQPWRLVAHELGEGVFGLMAADGVEGQGAVVFGWVDDLAVWQEPKFHQGLEAVADAEHEAVVNGEQAFDGFFEAFVAEEGRNVLAGAVWFVPEGEAAWQHEHLRVAQGFFHGVDGRLQAFGGEVADDDRFHLGAGAFEDAGGVDFAVGAWEYGEHSLWCAVELAVKMIRFSFFDDLSGVWVALVVVVGDGWVDVFEGAVVGAVHGLEVNGGIRPGEAEAGGDGAEQGGVHVDVVGQFKHEGADSWLEQGLEVAVLGKGDTEMVADGHFVEAFHHAALANAPSGNDFAGFDGILDGVVEGFEGGAVDTAIVFASHRHGDDLMAGFFEFRADDAVGFGNGGGEADQRWWHVHVFKGAAHGVLAADGRELEVTLRSQSTKQGFEWLAPAGRIVLDAVEVFLHGEIDVVGHGAGGDELHDGFEDGMVSAPELVGAHGIWREAVSKHADGVGFPFKHRNLGHHGLNWGGLVFAAEWEQHGASADGGVELFHEAGFGADVEPSEVLFHGFGLVFWHGDGLVDGSVLGGDNRGFLAGAGRVDKGARQVNDVLTAVFDDHAAGVGDVSHVGAFEVFFVGHGLESFPVFLGDDAGHAFLRFGDGQLGAGEAFVFLRHTVEVDVQAVGQFADGNGNAASAEVVAALDHAGDFRTAEQALNLAFFDRVPLLHFCAGGFQRVDVLVLGGTGGAAAAVAAGFAAEEHDDVARFWALADDVFSRRCSNHSSYFHALGFVARMVHFVDNAGGHADLVAVGRKALGSQGADFALWQLAFEGFLNWLAWVGCAGHAHALVHIAAAAERVTNGAAKAGGCTAERFDFRWVVVGFVLEHVDPWLFDAVDVNVGLDAAGVDFFAFVKIAHEAMFLEVFGGNGAEVHKGDWRPFFAVCVNIVTQGEVFVVHLLHSRVFDGYIGDDGVEGGVTAVVGPVGVDHFQFGFGWIALFLDEVALQESEVVHVHGQAIGLDDVSEAIAVRSDEAAHRWHGVSGWCWLFEGFRLFEGGQARFHWVDEVVFHGLDVVGAEAAAEHIDERGLNDWAFAGDDFDALGAGIGALVVLARQRFHSQDGFIGIGFRQGFGVDRVYTWFRKHEVANLFGIERSLQIQVVATDDAHVVQALQAQIATQRLQERGVFFTKLFLAFHKKAFDFAHVVLPLLQSTGANVAAELHVVKGDLFHGGIGFVDGAFDGGVFRSYAEHTAAVGDDLVVFQRGAGMEDDGVFFCDGVEAMDWHALFGAGWIAAGSHDDADSRFIVPFQGGLIEGAVQAGLEEIDDVGFHADHDWLGFWIAEAHVVFEHAWAFFGQHQPGVENAGEWCAFGSHGGDGWSDDGFIDQLGEFFGVHWGWGISAHTAGVWPFVAVEDALMVLSGHHWQHMLAISESEHADFRPFHVFFDDDGGAGVAESVIGEHVFDGFVGFVAVHADDDALAGSEAVGFDHARHADFIDEGLGRCHFGEGVEGSRWDVVLLHKFLGERLAAFETCSGLVRAEASQACFLEGVHDAKGQRQFWTNDGEVDGFGFGEVHEALDVIDFDIDEGCHVDHADVAWGSVDFSVWVLCQFPAEGVFTTAAANY